MPRAKSCTLFSHKRIVTKGCKANPRISYQWYIHFVDINGKKLGEKKCKQPLNDKLEFELKNVKDEPITFTFQSVTIELKKNEYSITSMDNDCTYKLIRKVIVAGKCMTLPKNWEPFQSHSCTITKIPEKSVEFESIASTFYESMTNYKIHEISRIQNLISYQKYSSISNIRNEKFLFHGTNHTSPSSVVCSQEGFDPRLSKISNLWGSGSYFAEDASYANNYAHYSQGLKCIIVASVLLGDCFDYGVKTNLTLTKPPRNFKTKKFYDSVSGITCNSRVYAVYNSAQSYARYIIYYK